MRKMCLPLMDEKRVDENPQFKPGDLFTAPMVFQVLRALGQEDRVYYLCNPVDQPKHYACLKDSFFVVCTENAHGAEFPEIPAAVCKRAAEIVDTAMKDPEDPDNSTDAGDDYNPPAEE